MVVMIIVSVIISSAAIFCAYLWWLDGQGSQPVAGEWMPMRTAHGLAKFCRTESGGFIIEYADGEGLFVPSKMRGLAPDEFYKQLHRMACQLKGN